MVPNKLEIIEQARDLKYKTPFFYTSKSILKNNYESFTHLFDNEEVYYAIKANSDIKILEYLKKLGCGFEAASFFEIKLLLDLGVKPGKIIYGTSVKPANHIRLAMKSGVNRMAADSKEEIEKIASNAAGAKIFVRAQVNDSDSVFAFSERFGSPLENIVDLLLYARKRGLTPYGISFHVGSQAIHVEHWSDAILSLKPIIEKLQKSGLELEIINIGGGFPVTYNNHKQVPHLSDIVEHIHNTIHLLPYMPKIIMEPGRGIVATSTVMVSEVISRTTRRGKDWLVLDGGVYNCLYEAMIHQGTTQYEVHTTRKARKDTELSPYVLSGPTGDSIDIITRDISLPSSIKVGDRLIFENAGAYTITMSSPFNGFPKPELYLG